MDIGDGPDDVSLGGLVGAVNGSGGFSVDGRRVLGEKPLIYRANLANGSSRLTMMLVSARTASVENAMVGGRG
jgi:hypothetical protein